MTMVSQFNYETNSWDFNPALQMRENWRKIVESVAQKARAVLPEPVHGRIDKAIQIVLNGDVELLPDDKAKVGSQSNGVTKYYLVDGTCDCRDFEKAVDHWCKHRLAYGIYKRARALAKEQLKALDDPTSKAEPVTPVVETPVTEPVEPVTPIESDSVPLVQAEPVVSPVTLPEAPASVNCHIMIEGRQVQVTLRGTDETVLLARLATLLQQYPVAEPPKPPPTQGTGEPVPDENPYCQLHKVPLKKFTKDGRTWFSHKAPNGSWCRGK